MKTMEFLHLDPSTHPKNYIWDRYAILPNNIRPEVKRFNSTKGYQTEITRFLNIIVTYNNKIPTGLKDNWSNLHNPVNLQNCELLELMIHSFIRGIASNTKQTRIVMGNNTNVSLTSHITGKHAHIRNELMGKRCHKTSRCVISGDPIIPMTHVIIPEQIAKKIQIPVVVKPWNIDELNIYFNNRDLIYPGSKDLIKASNGHRYSVAMVSNYKLQVNDILYRNLIEDDYVLLNRAPSLKPSSLTSLKVRIGNSTSMKFSQNDCPWYNSDFDGDEMLGIYVGSHTARAELDILMSSSQRAISYQDATTDIGIYHDSIISLAQFTRHGQTFNRFETMQLFGSVLNHPRLRHLKFDKESYTNYEIVSMLLPDINFKGKPGIFKPEYAPFVKYDPNDITVLIKNGELKSGILDKKNVGRGNPNSIIAIINNQYSSKVAMDFISNMDKVMYNYIAHRGMTLSSQDMSISHEIRAQVRSKIGSMISASIERTKALHAGKIIPPIGYTIEQAYEEDQINTLTLIDAFHDTVIKDMDGLNNNLFYTIMSGSAGKMINFTNMSTAIGQILVNGARIKMDYGFNRASQYSQSFDLNPLSRGFCDKSYNEGISLLPFIVNAMTSRTTIIEKSMGTAKSGAQSRISGKNLQRLLIDNRFSVVKSGENKIMQILYSDTGIDCRFKSYVQLKYVFQDFKTFESNYRCTQSKLDSKYAKSETILNRLNSEFEQLKKDRDLIIENALKYEKNSGPANIFVTDSFNIGVNVPMLMYNIINKYENETNFTLDPMKAMDTVSNLVDSIVYCAFNQNCKDTKYKVPEYFQYSVLLVRIVIRAYLCMVELIDKKINNNMLEEICESIYNSYTNAYMDYGTPIGIISALALSEPTTQLSLHATHGTGAVNPLTQLTDLYMAKSTLKMKYPKMLIGLKDQPDGTPATEIYASKIGSFIETIIIKQMIEMNNVGVSLFYEDFSDPIHPDFIHEKDLIKKFVDFNGMKPGNLSHWCIRFEVLANMLAIKNMHLDDIVAAIYNEYKGAYVVYDDSNPKKIVVRVYFANDFINLKAGQDAYDFMRNVTDSILVLQIRGIKHVKSVRVTKLSRTVFNKETGRLSKVDRVYLETEGINMTEILSNPYVNKYDTYCNNILEVKKYYGIAAARNMIIYEIDNILKDNTPAREHLGLIADEMTSLGYITSIELNKLADRNKHSELLNISSAKPAQQLIKSALSRRGDNLSNVSSCLMLGTFPKLGSTFNNVLLNEKFISQNTNTEADLMELL
jgi:DNA-directed RNA polymerase II subunit RPB1